MAHTPRRIPVQALGDCAMATAAETVQLFAGEPARILDELSRAGVTARGAFQMGASRSVAHLAMNSRFCDLRIAGRGNADRSCGVAAETGADRCSRASGLNGLPHRLMQGRGGKSIMPGCESEQPDGRIVAQRVFEIKFATHLADESNRVVTRPESPLDRQLYDVLAVVGVDSQSIGCHLELKTKIGLTQNRLGRREPRCERMRLGAVQSPGMAARRLAREFGGVARFARRSADVAFLDAGKRQRPEKYRSEQRPHIQ